MVDLLKSLESRIDIMKAEITAGVLSGRVPCSVESFGDLHDYVDANEYGEICEDEVYDNLVEHFGGRDADEGMPQGMVDFINALQDAGNAWIKSGALLTLPRFRCEWFEGYGQTEPTEVDGTFFTDAQGFDADDRGFILTLKPGEEWESVGAAGERMQVTRTL